jgi:sugar lactone lactonase YvrE
MIYDDTLCDLGEGPLWHPGRGQLFWFDILGRRLLTREDGRCRTWEFGEHVSAAGWVSDGRLLVASETRLLTLDLDTDRGEDVAPLEADDPRTRSNDGRADPWGGFWIGTMGKKAEPGLGAIYRLYRGEIRTLFRQITVSNAICFAPDRTSAYFADSRTKVIRRTALDDEGWPAGEARDWLDFSGEAFTPDGAVTDTEGNVWNARWGGGSVACHAPDGTLRRELAFDAVQTTCPAFGGPGLTPLFCTSARDGRSGENDGRTFAVEGVATGLPEPRVIL